jgi:hypothetical protein
MTKPEISQNSNDVPPSMVILQLISSYRISQSIYVAAKLGIAEEGVNAHKPSIETFKKN